MTLSLNQRAHELADRIAADGDALRTAMRTLPGGTRVIDCGSAVPGGLEAGRRLAEITMAGLGSVAFAPVVLGGRSLPGLTVVTDHPALACLASQYAGWKIDREGYFAMASGPGRALIRAEELFDDLDVDERASERGPLPGDARRAAGGAGGVRGRARRRGAGRPHADLRADGESRRRRPDRRAHRRDGAAQAARDRLRRAARGERLRDLPAAARGAHGPGGDRAHERRGALRRPGRAHRRCARRRARGDRRAAARLRVEGPRRAVRQPSSSGRTGTSTRSTRCCSARPRSAS